jgi:hypothetical protein
MIMYHTSEYTEYALVSCLNNNCEYIRSQCGSAGLYRDRSRHRQVGYVGGNGRAEGQLIG